MTRTWKMWMMVLAAALLPLALGLPNAESRTDAAKAHTAKKPRLGKDCRHPIYVYMSGGTGFGRQRLIDTELTDIPNADHTGYIGSRVQITVAKGVTLCKRGLTNRNFSVKAKSRWIRSRVRIWRYSTRSYVMSYRFFPTGTPGVYSTKVFKYWDISKYKIYAEGVGRFKYK